MKHAEFIKGLRDMAEFFDANPQLEVPYDITCFDKMTARWITPSKAEMAAFAHLCPGTLLKEVTDRVYHLRCGFGTFSVDAFTFRDRVCERIQTGETEEPEHIIPAVPEQVVPAKTVPIYEWRCPDSLMEPEA